MYQLIDGIPVWGEAEEGALRHIRVSSADERVAFSALMADNHQGYMSMPVGGVIAYSKEWISPSAAANGRPEMTMAPTGGVPMALMATRA